MMGKMEKRGIRTLGQLRSVRLGNERRLLLLKDSFRQRGRRLLECFSLVRSAAYVSRVLLTVLSRVEMVRRGCRFLSAFCARLFGDDEGGKE